MFFEKLFILKIREFLITEEDKLTDTLDIFNLKGKKAVITGGAGILGSAIARGLGKAGTEVAICDIVSTNKVVNELKKEGIKAKGYYIDVMDIKKIKACHNEIINDFDRIDILINAAGGNIKEATSSKELSFLTYLYQRLKKLWGLIFSEGLYSLVRYLENL